MSDFTHALRVAAQKPAVPGVSKTVRIIESNLSRAGLLSDSVTLGDRISLDLQPEYTLQVIPPWTEMRNPRFRGLALDALRYEKRIKQIQRLRGDDRPNDGADYHCWHVIAVDAMDQVRGCVRMRRHDPALNTAHLSATQGLLDQTPSHDVKRKTCKAILALWARARQEKIGLAEISGITVPADSLETPLAIQLGLSVWALCRHLGDAFAVAPLMASEPFARTFERLGAKQLTHDGKPVAMLCVDSRYVARRYEQFVADLEAKLFGSARLVRV
jgi:hypothetical protein